MAKLGEVASVIRGAQITAAELRQMTGGADSDFRYITVSGIGVAGLLTDGCQRISEPPERFRRFVIEQKCVVLSKFAPFKAALVEPDAGGRYLAGGNLYIICADESAVTSEYLCTYLLGATAQSRLKSLAKGTVLPNLSAESLRDMNLPEQTANERARISSEFRRLRAEVARRQTELMHAESAIGAFLERM